MGKLLSSRPDCGHCSRWQDTPFFKGYQPQFFFRTTNVTGKICLPHGSEMVMPGDNAEVLVDPE